MNPAAASAAHGSAISTTTQAQTPSSSGSTYSDGTLKFLKLQIGSVETSSNAVPISTAAVNSGYCAACSSRSQPSDCASSPRKSGNNTKPAPAGAGTPVKKL